MKPTALFIILLFSSIFSLQAQEPEIKVYGFASDYDTAVDSAYVSEVFEAVANGKVYFDPSAYQIENQMKFKIKEYTGKNYGFVYKSNGFCFERFAPLTLGSHKKRETKLTTECTFENIQQKRKDAIASFKKNNFKVKEFT